MNDLHQLAPSDEAIDAEFSPARRREILEEVLASRGNVMPLTRRCRWPAALAVAAASVAVVAVVGQALLPGADPLIAEPSTPTPSGTSSQAATATAVEQLSAVAESAAAAPPLPEGSFLHVRVVQQFDDEPGGMSTDDTYTDAAGWTWMHRYDEIEAWTLEDAGDHLRQLPTEPGPLEALIRGGEEFNSDDERAYHEMVGILRSPAATADIRSAAVLVLQRLAREPQAPETTETGDVATPRVTVTTTQVNGGKDLGWRISLTDATATPDAESWIILDSAGTFLEAGNVWEGGGSGDVVVEQGIVEALPEEFVAVLGTDHVEQSYF